MNLLYLHQYFQTNNTAGGTRSFEFAKYLSEKGVRVSVITGTELDKNFISKNNFYVYSTHTKYSNSMTKWKRILAFLNYSIKALVKGLKIKNLDIIFATSTPLTVGLPAVLISKLRRKKLIFEVRDVWPDVPIELGYIKSKLIIKLLKAFELWIYRNSEHIIVLSEGMYNNLIAKGINKNKITIIENMAILYLYDEVKGIYKPSYLEDKFVCIHPGTMGDVNGLDFILDVAKYTLEFDKDIIFLLIGDGKRKEHLKERVKQEKLTNVIIKNPIPKKEILKIIKTSDIGIMCVDNKYKILEDNSANKFFDFLAAGLPVLINYEGWQKEILEKNKCGESHLVPESMATTIIKLKNDNKLRKEMGKNSRILAEKKYSDILAKQKLFNVITNVCEK